jgi:hypothetical protein
LSGFKHLVQCHCILPQYRKLDNPIFHKFVVFSSVDEDEDVIPKIVKCNNCEVAHKIIDFCKSEVLIDGEDVNTMSILDIRKSISENVCLILDDNNCDIATWEQVKDIIENKLWGSVVVLSSKRLSGVTNIKTLVINDKDDLKIETNLRQDDLVGR